MNTHRSEAHFISERSIPNALVAREKWGEGTLSSPIIQIDQDGIGNATYRERMALSATEVAHLLRRTGFSATRTQIDSHLNKTREQLVDFVLDFTPNASLPALDFGTEIEEYRRHITLMDWWMNRMASAPAPLEERLTLFWHNHFATSFTKVYRAKAMADQNQLFRTLGTGNLNTLVTAVSIDPAMLVWLDNGYNFAGSPNENFGRELLELFLLGANQGYGESDVRAMARTWTGHRLTINAAEQYGYLFDPALHDNDNKTLFGVTGNFDGPPAVDAMIVLGGQLNIVRTRIAKFIAVKLWSWFAAPKPSDTLANQLGALLAEDPNMNIKVFLRKMFLLDEFYSPTTRGGLVRHPIDWLVTQMRASGFRSYAAISNTFSLLSMEPTLPPNVAGWKSNKAWYSEATYWARNAVASELFQYVTAPAPGGNDFLASTDAMTPELALQTALDAFGEDRIVPGTPSWNALLGLLNAERAAGSPDARRNLARAITLSPEFTLA